MAARKKLIYILNSYSVSEASHFTHVLRLLEAISKRDCDIVLLIEKARSLPKFSSPAVRAASLSFASPILRHVELFVRLVSLIFRGYRRTYVRITAPAAIVASAAHRLFGGEVYFWQSGTTHEHDRAQPLSWSKIKWYFGSYVPNALARKMAHFFVTGPETMVDYYSRVVGVAREKIVLLYNDIDLDYFRRDVDRTWRRHLLAQHSLPDNCMLLLLVHRLSPVRRTLTYLTPMLAALSGQGVTRKWALLVAGGGSELPAAVELVKSMNMSSNVIFLGEVPNREIRYLYDGSDIFVHPTFTEGFPRVILEAMAFGLPIVTTDAGGTRELLGAEQRSYIADRRNPNEFADKLLNLIGRPEHWHRLSDESRRAVARFSTPTVADMYVRAIFNE
jgi:glycosyltransferase involved in cell wall biosynthesis